MLGIGRRRRAREEAARQAWLARRQEIYDPVLRQRVIDLIDGAIASAEDVETVPIGAVQHTSAWWTWRQDDDTSAQKGVHPDGVNYQLSVDPDDGPWVVVTSRRGAFGGDVLWMPGLEFERPEQFLDWFETMI
jgi:hypothetical protein